MYCDIVAALASSSSAAQGTSPAETRTTGSALAPSWSEAAHAPAGHITHRETGGHAGTHAQSGSNGSVWLSGSVGGEGDGQREEEMGVAPGVQLMSTSPAACKMGLGCGLHVIVVETALPGPRLLHGDARGDGAEGGRWCGDPAINTTGAARAGMLPHKQGLQSGSPARHQTEGAAMVTLLRKLGIRCALHSVVGRGRGGGAGSAEPSQACANDAGDEIARVLRRSSARVLHLECHMLPSAGDLVLEWVLGGRVVVPAGTARQLVMSSPAHASLLRAHTRATQLEPSSAGRQAHTDTARVADAAAAAAAAPGTFGAGATACGGEVSGGAARPGEGGEEVDEEEFGQWVHSSATLVEAVSRQKHERGGGGHEVPGGPAGSASRPSGAGALCDRWTLLARAWMPAPGAASLAGTAEDEGWMVSSVRLGSWMPPVAAARGGFGEELMERVVASLVRAPVIRVMLDISISRCLSIHTYR